MSNPTEIADAIVALGIGKEANAPGLFWIGLESMDAETFINDWRVAGALMEKCVERYKTIRIDYSKEPEDLGRAIVEACVSALREKGGG